MSMDGGAADPKGGETDKGKGQLSADELKAQLRAELEAEHKAKLDKLQSVIDEKITGKKELEDRLKAEAEKRGEYDTALTLHKKELEDAKAELAKAKTDLEALEALKAKADEYDAMIQRRRDELMALIPEDEKKTLEHASIEILEAFAKRTQAPGYNARPKPGNGTANGTKWSEMSPAERIEKARVLSVEDLRVLISQG